jgi:hypothetical protein
MTRAEAREWLNEWNRDCGTKGVFVIISRPVGAWKLSS